MFCSTIIPTVHRPSLRRTVESVLSQNLEEPFEVIVVNDSGRPLTDGEWYVENGVRVINTQRRERSVARNTGAAVSRGRFLHFLDDDDWLVPGALAALHRLTLERDADWYYGGSQLVDRSGFPLLQLHHGLTGNGFCPVMAGEWIPLQSSLIPAAAFFRIGGFNPRLTGPEDIDLCRRILLQGDLAGTQAIVATIAMGRENSTTDYDRHADASRAARELILDRSGVFERLLASAPTGRWRGRLVRIYLTSALWNGGRLRGITAVSRALYGLAGAAASLPHLLSPPFWHALLHAYQSDTFAKGRDAAQAKGNPQDRC